LLAASSIVLYAITYVALFALPLFGRAVLRAALPGWVKVAAACGFAASLISLFTTVYPIVDVVSKGAYATKICSVVVIANMTGILIYRSGGARR
jgi:hypothetical protein